MESMGEMTAFYRAMEAVSASAEIENWGEKGPRRSQSYVIANPADVVRAVIAALEETA